jgi:hypothetical protein
MKLALALGAAAATILGLGAVTWPQDCTSTPPRHWLTPLEVEARLRESGLRLQSIRQDESRCFSVVARDGQGRVRSLTVNPADGSVVAERE